MPVNLMKYSAAEREAEGARMSVVFIFGGVGAPINVNMSGVAESTQCVVSALRRRH